ncbi:MAG: LamB/YcsF family protein [Firmicutes bacterium]|nr:LamB/YcsF family protein [Bacillota bacterium]
MLIDLNCDLGESFGPYTLGNDEEIMPYVTSVNVACGLHAGDPMVLRRTLRAARRLGLAVGAHPGFPDLQGFGRRNMDLSPQEVENYVLWQIGAVWGLAQAEGVVLQHVKPHGALYNLAARDGALAQAIARAVASVDRSLILMGPAGSQLVQAGLEAGLAVAAEAFADRGYRADGSLIPRGQPGALVTDAEEVAANAVQIAVQGKIRVRDGSGAVIPLRAQTLCVHGDTPGAVQLVRSLRQRLEAHGVHVAPLRDVLSAGAV